MEKAVFYIAYPIIWTISKLPFAVLYGVSDVIYLILFYIIRYRKKLVLSNLKMVFPGKSEKELKKIRRKFYRHFVDIFMEMIKTFTITPDELDKHFKIINNDVLLNLAAKNKSTIVMAAHYGNWEWTIKVGNNTPFERFGIYAKIRNRIFSQKIKETRERFDMHLILKSHTIKTLSENVKNNILSVYGFLSDQSPHISKAYYWTDFLGKRVPVLNGAEMLAKKYNHAVVFAKIKKIKRGYYTLEFELIVEEPNSIPDFQITEKYLKIIEEQIKEQPEFYFWTHNRFKLMGKEHLSPAQKK